MSRRKHKPKPAPIPAASGDVIELPPEERGVPPEVVAKFDYERRRLLNPLSTPKAREDAARNIANLEANREKWGERAWQERVQAENEGLAAARGEEVVREGPRTRVVSRDGLYSAMRAKDGLTQKQYEIGLRYRAGWQARSADVGSQLGAVGHTSAGHDNNRFVANRASRAMMLQALGKMERAVAIQCSAEPACLQMLRWVAGEGHSLSAFGEGRAYERNMRALKRALEVAGTAS